MWHVFSSFSCFSQAHTVGCEFQKVNCVYPECGKMVTKILLPDHLENECEFRPVACELCQSQVIFCKLQVRCLGSLLKKHINSGSDVALSCAKFFLFSETFINKRTKLKQSTYHSLRIVTHMSEKNLRRAEGNNPEVSITLF